MRIRQIVSISVGFFFLVIVTAADTAPPLQPLSSSDDFARFLSATAAPPKQEHRSLFGGYTNVICSLTDKAYPVIWNASDAMFYFPDLQSRLNGTDQATEEDVQKVIQEILGELSEGEYEMVRLCWCTQYAQLPVEFCSAQFDTCMVTAAPKKNRPAVSCYNGEMGDTIVRSFKPILIFWIIALLYGWSCTIHGQTARAFLRRVFCCRSGEDQLEAFLQNEPERASYMYQQHLQRVRRNRQWRSQAWYVRLRQLRGLPVEEEADEPEETQLKLTLKTKLYHDESLAPSTEKSSLPLDEENAGGVVERNDDDDESSLSEAHCIICLLSLEEGDTIGDIPCGHLIHKDCLKDWLRRKNRCPLCQQTGIATLSIDK